MTEEFKQRQNHNNTVRIRKWDNKLTIDQRRYGHPVDLYITPELIAWLKENVTDENELQ